MEYMSMDVVHRETYQTEEGGRVSLVLCTDRTNINKCITGRVPDRTSFTNLLQLTLLQTWVPNLEFLTSTRLPDHDSGKCPPFSIMKEIQKVTPSSDISLLVWKTVDCNQTFT